MEHSHGDHHDDHGHHDHAAGANARALTLALMLTFGFLLVEITGAWAFSSLALLSDAAHMATDSAALAIALLANRIALRPASDQRSYGDRRVEVLAAFFNSLVLLLVVGWILIEAIFRLFAPAEVLSVGMFSIAVAGLIVNLIGMRILSAGRDENLNMKGAYLEL
jgi:cobalt-zinc-cadmium efflux system protein